MGYVSASATSGGVYKRTKLAFLPVMGALSLTCLNGFLLNLLVDRSYSSPFTRLTLAIEGLDLILTSFL
jgi:hypothetical protein